LGKNFNEKRKLEEMLNISFKKVLQNFC